MDKLRSLLLYLVHKVNDNKCYFLKMGQSRRPLFVYFRLFLITIQILNCKSKDGDRTRARSIVGADGSTELWRLPWKNVLHKSPTNGFEPRSSRDKSDHCANSAAITKYCPLIKLLNYLLVEPTKCWKIKSTPFGHIHRHFPT